jgi:hypothetical protein
MPRCGYLYPVDHEYGAVLTSENFWRERDNKGRTRFHGRCKSCEKKAHRIYYHAKKSQAAIKDVTELPTIEATTASERRRRVVNFDADDAIPFYDLTEKEQRLRRATINAYNVREAVRRNHSKQAGGEL